MIATGGKHMLLLLNVPTREGQSGRTVFSNATGNLLFHSILKRTQKIQIMTRSLYGDDWINCFWERERAKLINAEYAFRNIYQNNSARLCVYIARYQMCPRFLWARPVFLWLCYWVWCSNLWNNFPEIGNLTEFLVNYRRKVNLT